MGRNGWIAVGVVVVLLFLLVFFGPKACSGPAKSATEVVSQRTADFVDSAVARFSAHKAESDRLEGFRQMVLGDVPARVSSLETGQRDVVKMLFCLRDGQHVRACPHPECQPAPKPAPPLKKDDCATADGGCQSLWDKYNK